MAKIDENKYKRALLQRTEGYAASVRVIYLDVMERLISLALEVEPIHDPKKPFSFTDYGNYIPAYINKYDLVSLMNGNRQI